MSKPTLRATYAGKHVLVTGVTGFLGKVWLAMMLDLVPEVRKFTVVARGQKGQNAEERFRRIVECSPAFRTLRERLGPGFRALIADKVEVLDAALTRPLCGLSRDEAKRIMADVDVVVHFAGLVDFEPDPRQSIDANILGAKNVADLAALSPSRRYVHCSTCFVAGMKSAEIPETITPGLSPNGTRFDPETELRELEAELEPLHTRAARIDHAMARAKRLGWPNIYTYTKGLSEHMAESRTDLVQTTVRPAIVECARSYPFPGWNEGVNTSAPIVWLLSTTFRRFPARPTTRFDVVPVDTVARAVTLATAAVLRGEAKPVYQVASGHMNPLFFDRATELTNLAVRKMHQTSEDFFERHVLSRMDAVHVDPDRKQVFGIPEMKRLAGELKDLLRKADLKGRMPPNLYAKHGEDLDAEVKSLSTKLRTTERKLGTVEEMLKQFRPFIHDYDFLFRTDHLAEETRKLSGEELELFGFDIASLDWRHYWMKIQVPGLETWSIPVLRGEKVSDDPPLPGWEEPTTARRAEVVGITVQA